MRYKRVEKSKCMRSLCEEFTSCPTYCSDRCSWLSPVEKEIAELKAALANIQAVAVNNLDHDMHRVYKMCDEALEATK